MKKIALACGGCGRPWAYIAQGRLFVSSRHGGDQHTNSISLETLIALLGLSESHVRLILERPVDQSGFVVRDDPELANGKVLE